MAKKSDPPRVAPALESAVAQEILSRLNHVIVNYRGPYDELQSAIGMYLIGRLMGWKVIVLLHNKRTVRKYEEILGGVNVREEFPATTEFSNKSLGFELVTKLGNFWKGVNGVYDNDELRENRRKLAL